MTRSWRGSGKNALHANHARNQHNRAEKVCRWILGKVLVVSEAGVDLLLTDPLCFLLCRRYVKQSQSPNSESRASASATLTSCSQAPECSLSSSLGGCGSPHSEEASCSASSSNGSNHSGTCNETNGLYDGKLHSFLQYSTHMFKTDFYWYKENTDWIVYLVKQTEEKEFMGFNLSVQVRRRPWTIRWVQSQRMASPKKMRRPQTWKMGQRETQLSSAPLRPSFSPSV